jgi:hypothetical protein
VLVTARYARCCSPALRFGSAHSGAHSYYRPWKTDRLIQKSFSVTTFFKHFQFCSSIAILSLQKLAKIGIRIYWNPKKLESEIGFIFEKLELFEKRWTIVAHSFHQRFFKILDQDKVFLITKITYLKFKYEIFIKKILHHPTEKGWMKKPLVGPKFLLKYMKKEKLQIIKTIFRACTI